jgi:tetratricopeptide (TPR) repeat protein
MTSITHAGPRRGPRAAGLVLAALAIVGGTYVASGFRAASPPMPAPRVAAPGSATTPLDAGNAPTISLAQIDHSIDAWSKNLATNDHDYLAATNLAVLYQGRGRLSYDLADYQRSLDAARRALAIEPGLIDARLAEASTLVSLHDFDGARSTADTILADDPSQPGALAVRFDAEIELGRIDDARRDLAALGSVAGPAVLIRQARLASVTGDADGALRLAVGARNAAVDDEVQDLGIYQYAIGEYARLAGDAATARAGYEAALAIRPGDLGALVGLARIDAYAGSTRDAIDRLRTATAIAPQPEALALLGDLLQGADAGDPEAAKAFDTIRFIERLGDVQATTFDRQLLRFDVDHGGATDALLARVRTSVEARPDASGHDLLAWTLYRLGRYPEASQSISAARSVGADDARLRFHDGAIQLALGDAKRGRQLLGSASDLGPALDPADRAEVARLLAR